MCSIFISILCIFRGEKSEDDNEFVVSTTRAVNTSAPCQHMGSRYPWRVINPTNGSNAFILGFSLKMQLELCKRLCTNTAGTGMALLREGTQQESSPSLSSRVPLSSSGQEWDFIPQPGQTLSLGSSKEGGPLQESRWCRAHRGWLPLAPALWARVTSTTVTVLVLTEPEPDQDIS